MKTNKALQVLLVQCELSNWQKARSWSYECHLGIEEGLRANDVEFLTLTTPWIFHAREICAGRQFDQVWINDIVHLDDCGYISESDMESNMEWIANLAPIRIGFFIESLDYSPEDYAAAPGLLSTAQKRRRRVKKYQKYLTHVVAADEQVVTESEKVWNIPAIWFPPPVPGRCIHENVLEPSVKTAIFSGSIYGDRANYLKHPDLENLLINQVSPENYTIYPTLFNSLPGHRFRRFVKSLPANIVYPLYIHFLRQIRRRCFAMWLQGLQSGAAVVNLPSLFRGYPGRVASGMAVGRPVISWEIPDRPMTKALFENGEEILLYSNPEQFAEHIHHVLSDPDFGRRIAEKARCKLKRFHTIEKRVSQILNWVEKGEIPTYV